MPASPRALLCYIGTMGEGSTDQARVLAFLASREAYHPVPGLVERIDTHASAVFLAGEHAYKVKRAVKYPFLDFSTLELRRRACLNELCINRRAAPHLYLEVIPVTLSDRGDFALGGNGEGKVVEWVLVMRRFDQAESLRPHGRGGTARPRFDATPRPDDRRLPSERGPVLGAAAERLGAVLGARGQRMPPLPGRRPRFHARLSQRSIVQAVEALAALEPLLKARALGGYVRHCHGDLHLRNIVEIDGAPVLFDAIEFDDAIATVDVLYDLAFLLMDLGARGLPAHANAVLNAYLDACGDTGNLIGLQDVAAIPLNAGDDQSQGRAAACGAWPCRATDRGTAQRSLLCPARERLFCSTPAAARCHWRTVRQRQVERGAGASAASRLVSGGGACAQRCGA